MKPEHFHVLVIGGGPAGASAAYTLAAHGARTLLIDKAIFPRDKLCGGLLSLRCKKVYERIFQKDWSPVIQRRCSGARFYYQTTLLAEVRDWTDLFLTCRRDFDAFLLGQAVEQGARLIQGKQPVKLAPENRVLYLENGTEFSYDYLVGADGVHSFVARTLWGSGHNRRGIGFALEAEVPLTPGMRGVTDPEIYFGLIPWGYGWVFPKRETLTVGLGGLHTKNPRLKSSFEQFLRQQYGVLPDVSIRGHFVPFHHRISPGREGILLCGDAAGLVEPITGEGIAFALQSGYDAAEAIWDAMQAQDPGSVGRRYRERSQALVADFRRAHRLRYLVFPRWAQGLVAKSLPHHEGIARRHLDLLADKISYTDYTHALTASIFRRLYRKISPWSMGRKQLVRPGS